MTNLGLSLTGRTSCFKAKLRLKVLWSFEISFIYKNKRLVCGEK